MPDAIRDLLRRSGGSGPDLLAVDVALAVASMGGDHAVVYLVDYAQASLCPLLAFDQPADDAPVLTIDTTMGGRCFQRQEVVAHQRLGGWRVWVPIRERSDRLGVLELDLPSYDEEIGGLCEHLGLVIGHLVHTAGHYTDAVENVRRRQAMSLSAEMQWDLLVPPLTFATRDVAVAGVLEPAYDVAGDAFDYSLNGPVLDLVVLDAMGHGLRSTLTSALALTAARHARRAGLDLVEMASAVDAALVAELGGESFVTGHLCRLDVWTGQLRWVNAGHPSPLLVRGLRCVGELRAEPCLPLGLGIRLGAIGESQLEPGDVVVLHSDGATEARPHGGVEFGIDRLVEQLDRHLATDRSPAEALRRLVGDVCAHRGAPLADDVTLVALTWRPPGPNR